MGNPKLLTLLFLGALFQRCSYSSHAAPNDPIQFSCPAGETSQKDGGTPTCSNPATSPSKPTSQSTSQTERARNRMYEGVDPRFIISLGVKQVNSGNLDAAIETFSQIAPGHAAYSESLIGKGTALALKQRMEEAVEVFTEALEIDPKQIEGWKRRAQARSSLKQFNEVASDFTQALKLKPGDKQLLKDRGVVYSQLKDHVRAIADLQAYTNGDTLDPAALNQIGYSYTELGNNTAAIVYLDQAIEMLEKYPNLQTTTNLHEVWLNKGRAFRELGMAREAEESFYTAHTFKDRKENSCIVYGLLKVGEGEHRTAISVMENCLGPDHGNVEGYYLLGGCYHALGEYEKAIENYEKSLTMENVEEINKLLQYLAFYQREVCLYTATLLLSPFSRFQLDDEFSPDFKEMWGKNQPPSSILPNYPLQPTLSFSNFFFKKREREKQREGEREKERLWMLFPLLSLVDSLGKRTQYETPGFLKNRRQHRMAGFAMLELFQTLGTKWREQKQELRKLLKISDKDSDGDDDKGDQDTLGLNASSSRNPVATDEGKAKRDLPSVLFTWREAVAVAIRWRQISEPNDPVIWVDKMAGFGTGFGSNTPILSGNGRNVRYSPNFERAFNLMKRIILEKGFVYSDTTKTVQRIDVEKYRNRILKAEKCKDLWKLFKSDFHIVTPCKSTLRREEGHILEGTRISIVKSTYGFDFGIHTPCLPRRWSEYEREIEHAWDSLHSTVLDVELEHRDLQLYGERVEEKVLTLAFYWFNFMPLSRGSAMVGLILIFSFFDSLGRKVQAPIPRGMQVDWQALLTEDPQDFVQEMRIWMFKNSTGSNTNKCNSYQGASNPPELSHSPPVSSQVHPSTGPVDSGSSRVVPGSGRATSTSDDPDLLLTRIKAAPNLERILPTVADVVEALSTMYDNQGR